MNLLLLEPEEVLGKSCICVGGDRARHMIRVQGVEQGWRLRVGEIGGRMGTGVVKEVGEDHVILEVELAGEVPEPLPVDVVMALPRPQILKKVLQTAATLGIRRLALIRSERVEKSYFASPLLEPAKIRYYLLLGLEQGISTVPPEVSLHRRFRQFVDGDMGSFVEGAQRCLLAHPGAGRDISELGLEQSLSKDSGVVLAVGPEGGWQPHEIESFEHRGFVSFSFGERILRVETALCSLLGQIDILRKMSVRAGS